VAQSVRAAREGAELGSGRTTTAASASAALRTYLRTRDPAARDELVEHYMPLVISIARRYDHCGEPLEDLVQVGAIGLIQAIDRFDPRRGTQLSSFAIPTIEGEIRRELRDRGGTIRLPRSVQEARASVLGGRDQLAARLGRDPTDAELGAAVGLSAAAVSAALRAGSASTPATLVDSGSGVAQERGKVDGRLDASEDRLLLAGGFAALDERSRRVLHLRYFGGLSQTQIAKEVGLSQAHISRIIRDALAKLRDQLADHEHEDAPEPAISPQSVAVSGDEPAPADQNLASPPSAPTIAPMASSAPQTLSEYVDLPYHLTIAREDGAPDDEAWVATVEELDGCVARGGSPQDAAGKVREALEAWIALALARGTPVPLPRRPATHSGRLLLRMAPSLHADLARAAEREDVSLNQFVSNALAGAVGWRGGSAVGDSSGNVPARGWTPALVVNAIVVGLVAVVAVVLLLIALTN